ncbi:hypothetical protein T484DRAFT_1930347, partial [Baffinella frigidus]
MGGGGHVRGRARLEDDAGARGWEVEWVRHAEHPHLSQERQREEREREAAWDAHGLDEAHNLTRSLLEACADAERLLVIAPGHAPARHARPSSATDRHTIAPARHTIASAHLSPYATGGVVTSTRTSSSASASRTRLPFAPARRKQSPPPRGLDVPKGKAVKDGKASRGKDKAGGKGKGKTGVGKGGATKGKAAGTRGAPHAFRHLAPSVGRCPRGL